jgi:hypothetical protein
LRKIAKLAVEPESAMGDEAGCPCSNLPQFCGIGEQFRPCRRFQPIRSAFFLT